MIQNFMLLKRMFEIFKSNKKMMRTSPIGKPHEETARVNTCVPVMLRACSIVHRRTVSYVPSWTKNWFTYNHNVPRLPHAVHAPMTQLLVNHHGHIYP